MNKRELAALQTWIQTSVWKEVSIMKLNNERTDLQAEVDRLRAALLRISVNEERLDVNGLQYVAHMALENAESQP